MREHRGEVQSLKTWKPAMGAACKVVVLNDTAQAGKQVDECIADHLDDLTQCTFSRVCGQRSEGSAAQLQAAKAVPLREARRQDRLVLPQET